MSSGLSHAAALWVGLLLMGCCPTIENRRTAEGIVIPLRLGEGLSNPNYADTSGRLRHDCLYIESSDPSLRYSIPRVSWYRFWPNGRVIYNWTDEEEGHLPTKADGDRWSRWAYVGRYCIEGDKIEIETMALFGDCWHYCTSFGTIRPDGSISHEGWQIDRGRWNERGFDKSYKPQEFRPHVVGDMQRMPEW